MYVSRQGKSTPRMWGIDDDDKIPGLARLTSLVHEHGSKIFCQLNHCGRQVVPRSVGLDTAVASSDVKELFLGTKPRPLREGQCDSVSCGPAMIADPYLFQHVKHASRGPMCVFCNACVARVGGLPVDCYHPRVRQEKDEMLAAE